MGRPIRQREVGAVSAAVRATPGIRETGEICGDLVQRSRRGVYTWGGAVALILAAPSGRAQKRSRPSGKPDFGPTEEDEPLAPSDAGAGRAEVNWAGGSPTSSSVVTRP